MAVISSLIPLIPFNSEPVVPISSKVDDSAQDVQKTVARIITVALIFFGFLTVVGIPFAVLGMHLAYSSSKLSSARVYSVGNHDLPSGRKIMFVNGIGNKKKHAEYNAKRLSEYAEGAKVSLIHNATHGIVPDIFECALGIPTYPAKLLKQQWHEFFKNGSEQKLLVVCHSGGAIHVLNALLETEESIRNNILVVAIAPAVIIPKTLCGKVYNYTNDKDFVTDLDVTGNIKNKSHLIQLPGDPNVRWDHAFSNRTFKEVLKKHTLNYIAFGNL